jgi:hypothetical protein
MDREFDQDQSPEAPKPPPPPEGALPSPPGRRRRGLLIAAGAVLLAVIGAGTWALVALRGTEDVLARMVPDDASVYVTGYLDPSAGQKLALRSMLEKFPETEDPEQLNDSIDQAIDDGLGDFGLESEDIRSWLGSQVGVAAWIGADAPPRLAFLAKSRDENGAERTLGKIRAAAEAAGVTWEQEEHEGVTIEVDRSGIFEQEQAYALFDDTVVFANSLEVVQRIIDTNRGVRASLETSDGYRRSIEPLPEDRLGLLYVNAGALLDDFVSRVPTETGDSDAIPYGDALIGLGGTLSAHPDGMAAEFHVALNPTELTAEERGALAGAQQNEALAFVPDDAYGLIAGTSIDQALPAQLEALRGLEPSFDQLDQELGLTEITEHLSGDIGLEVGPSDLAPVEGALLIGTDDEDAMRAFLERLAGFIVREVLASGPPELQATPTTEEYRGVTITTYQVPGLASLGVSPAYAVSDGMAVLGSFPQEVRDILDTKATGDDIRSAQRYRQVVNRLDDPNGFLTYVDVEAGVQAVRNALPPSEQPSFDAEVSQNLEPARRFGMSLLSTDELVSFRLFLVIE